MRLPPTFEARLVSARMLTTNVRELTFARADAARFEFAAGQWINLVLPAPDGEIRRAYSIASPPRGTSELAIAVTKVDGGPGSTLLHAMEIGGTLHAVGPQGFFTRPLESAGPSLFVATGTGVTPLRSMIHAAFEAEHDMPIRLIFGVRSEEDLIYRHELEALAALHPARLQVLPTLSRPHDEWPGLRGYVQTHVQWQYEQMSALGKGAPHVYVCGLARMVGSVRDLLRKGMGLPREVVHTERYD